MRCWSSRVTGVTLTSSSGALESLTSLPLYVRVGTYLHRRTRTYYYTTPPTQQLYNKTRSVARFSSSNATFKGASLYHRSLSEVRWSGWLYLLLALEKDAHDKSKQKPVQRWSIPLSQEAMKPMRLCQQHVRTSQPQWKRRKKIAASVGICSSAG